MSTNRGATSRITHCAKATSAHVGTGRHRCARRRALPVSAWLGIGALGVGLGAAVAGGSGIAHADRPAPSSTASTPGPKLATSRSAGSVDAPRAVITSGPTHYKTVNVSAPSSAAVTATDHETAVITTEHPSPAPVLGGPATGAVRSTVSAPVRSTVMTTSTVSPAADVSAPPSLLTEVTNALLTLGGLNTTTPSPAAGNLVQLVFYSAARWLEDTFNPAGIPIAGTPTIGAADPTTGAVTFHPVFTDAAGAPLTYQATSNQGTVTVNEDGVYTFIPNTAARLSATGASEATVTMVAYNGVQSTIKTIHVPLSVSTPTVLSTIKVFGIGTDDVAVSPNTGAELVLTTTAGVSVIDTATDSVTATVPVSSYYAPDTVAITPDGEGAYVTVPGGTTLQGGQGTVVEVNLFNNTVFGSTQVGYEPMGLAVGPAGTPAAEKLYVVNSCPSGALPCTGGNDTVSVINTATNKVTATITVGGFASEVAVSTNGKFAYVTNSGTVSVINTATNQVSKTIQTGITGNLGAGLAVSPNGKELYEADPFKSSLDVINATTGKVTAKIPVGNNPLAVAVSPDGSVVYVANAGEGNTLGTTVSVISTATNKVIDTITVGREPSGIAVSPDGAKLYVTTGDGLYVIGV